jgi:TrmH family RNA methyltransferase
VLALPGTAELANPKTIRATMGGCFRLPFVALDEAAFRQWALERNVLVLLAATDGGPAPRGAERPLAIVVGNEGAGLRPSLAAWAGGRIGVPLRPGAESLNVAVAAGILLYEVTRE